MSFFLTFNDPPSGIYSGQVIDVVKFLRKEFKTDMRLVAFISIRKFIANRRGIKEELPEAIVVPMIPGVKRWKLNALTLKLICSVFKPKLIIARSVLATNLVLMIKNKGMTLVYDGRGAIMAEWEEYGVVKDKELLNQISDLEKKSVLNSDFRISVSNKLLEYWKEKFAYKKDWQVIIPCTINEHFQNLEFNEGQIARSRERLGFKSGEKVIVYSGSLAGWQSVELLGKYLRPILSGDKQVKLLFLSDYHPFIGELSKTFPDRVRNAKFKPSEVPEILISADYGVLIRERSVTNEVASPVKYAEYLSCGLTVLISEGLGDYSAFTQIMEVGYVIQENIVDLPPPYEKLKCREIGLSYFTKSSHKESYRRILQLAMS